MLSTMARPSLSELYGLIDKVPTYPLTVRKLLHLARETRASRDVINFYKSFSSDQVFESQEDLATLSELIDIIRRDKSDMPREEPAVPLED